MHVVALLAVSMLLRQATPDAHAVVERARKAAERDSTSAVSAQWNRVLATRPNDRSALLGLATVARLASQFDRADSLAQRVIELGGRTPDAFTVLARMGIAQTMVTGRNPILGDTLLMLANREARQIGSKRLEAGTLVALSLVRARSVGTRAALDLIAESRRVYPSGLPFEESLRSCLEGNFGAQLGDSLIYRKLKDGIIISRKAREYRVHSECWLLSAQINEHRGFFTAALGDLDTATRYMRRVHSDVALAAALQWGAFVRVQTGDLERARREYLESVVLAKRTNSAAVEAWALTGLGNIGVVLGDLGSARDYLTQALALHNARNDRWGVAAVRELEGELYDALGNTSAARVALNESITMHTQLSQHLLALAPLRRLSRLELGAGRLDDAERALQRASSIAVLAKDDGWARELPYHQAGIAIARGQYVLADSLLGIIENREASRRSIGDLNYSYFIRAADLASRRNEWDSAERLMQRAMQTLLAWRLEFTDKDARLRVAQARRSWGTIGEEFPALVARLAQAGRPASAFALAEAARARELMGVTLQRAAFDPDSGHVTRIMTRLRATGAAASLSQVQQTLDDSTALLAYVAGRGKSPTTLFVVTRRTSTARALAPIDSIAPKIDRYLRLLTDGSEPTALARQLGDDLLSGAITDLPPNVSRLLIVPELSLYRVPFDALILADNRYVVERFTIAVVPSATFAVSIAGTQTTRPTGNVLAFGDAMYSPQPAFLRTSASAGAANTRAENMPRLPYSGDEVRRIALYSDRSRVLVRNAASKNALRRADLQNVRVLHLATHALIDDQSLQRNLLALSPDAGNDGLLGPEDLGALRFNQALVILSGCRTVGGVVLGGEGLRGLTAPLLEAGARTVVATQWAIGDESILPFIDRFYAHMASGVGVGTALRRAKMDAIRDRVRPEVWAAFVLVGDSSMRTPLTPIRNTLMPWGKALSTNERR